MKVSPLANFATARGEMMDKEKVKVFADRVFADMAGAMTAGMGYVGVKVGLFRAMAAKGPLRAEDVVRELGLTPRYVEEWLKGMTCAKYLDYDAADQTYRLSDEHAFLMASDDTDHFMGGLFGMVPVLLRVAPEVATAFSRGGGVPFEEFGLDGVVWSRPDEPGTVRTAAHQLLAEDVAGRDGSSRSGWTRSRRRLRRRKSVRRARQKLS